MKIDTSTMNVIKHFNIQGHEDSHKQWMLISTLLLDIIIIGVFLGSKGSH